VSAVDEGSYLELEKNYLTFIRPVLEYASEVWDNCGQINSDRLEKVQLEAARIATGLPSFATINYIDIEMVGKIEN
jgi:hypothetical protein